MNHTVQIDRRLPTHELNARRDRLRVLFAPSAACTQHRCVAQLPKAPGPVSPVPPTHIKPTAVHIIH